MFAYCLNNPVNYSDPTGALGIEAVIAELVTKGVINGVVGGFVNAVCTFSTTGSWEKTIEAFFVGFGEGFVVGIFDKAADFFIFINAVSTFFDCLDSGASFESSLLAGLVALGAGYAFGPTGDDGIDILLDLTFGLGSSLVSAGVTEAVQRNAQSSQQNVALPVITPVSQASNSGGGGGSIRRITTIAYSS